MPDADALFAAAEATWPPARRIPCGDWTLREGLGGGSRVSAATAGSPGALETLAEAEAGMAALGQTPLVMVRGTEEALDEGLAARGYALRDPVVILAAPARVLAERELPPVRVIECASPLAVQAEIWAGGGIGPARLAVMARTAPPRTALLGRLNDRPAGTAHLAAHGGIAIVHALEIAPRDRRQGLARDMMVGAARWALREGAEVLAVLVTRANAPAGALYRGLGMEPAAEYHYRIRSAP